MPGLIIISLSLLSYRRCPVSHKQLQDVERQGNHTLPGVKEATEPDSDTTQMLEPSDRGFKMTMIKRLKWKMWRTCSIRLVTSAERGKL